jgi:hypothetical protein
VGVVNSGPKDQPQINNKNKEGKNGGKISTRGSNSPLSLSNSLSYQLSLQLACDKLAALNVYNLKQHTDPGEYKYSDPL